MRKSEALQDYKVKRMKKKKAQEQALDLSDYLVNSDVEKYLVGNPWTQKAIKITKELYSKR